jgi:hypothetical protein
MNIRVYALGSLGLQYTYTRTLAFRDSERVPSPLENAQF